MQTSLTGRLTTLNNNLTEPNLFILIFDLYLHTRPTNKTRRLEAYLWWFNFNQQPNSTQRFKIQRRQCKNPTCSFVERSFFVPFISSKSSTWKKKVFNSIKIRSSYPCPCDLSQQRSTVALSATLKSLYKRIHSEELVVLVWKHRPCCWVTDECQSQRGKAAVWVCVCVCVGQVPPSDSSIWALISSCHLKTPNPPSHALNKPADTQAQQRCSYFHGDVNNGPLRGFTGAHKHWQQTATQHTPESFKLLQDVGPETTKLVILPPAAADTWYCSPPGLGCCFHYCMWHTHTHRVETHNLWQSPWQPVCSSTATLGSPFVLKDWREIRERREEGRRANWRLEDA